MIGEVDPTIINLTVFVLAVFVGYHVVWNVTPASAHAPDVGHQRDFRHYPGGRHARGRVRRKPTGVCGWVR